MKFNNIWQRFKARFARDEKHVGGGCERGRVYSQRKTDPGNKSAKGKVKGTVHTRVIRANGDVEDFGTKEI